MAALPYYFFRDDEVGFEFERVVDACFTALFAVARETVPVLGAEYTFLAATDFSASTFAALLLTVALDDPLRFLPALLACAFVGVFLVGMIDTHNIRFVNCIYSFRGK
ncbi:MAG: hypothetical protein V4732_13635 [Pseudomonadota bacterium]